MTICDKCPLAIHNNFRMVSPRGNINSKLFIIGEAPGYKEKKQGVVFVGKAGMYLQHILELVNLQDYSYLTNAIMCRPPMNRTPNQNEISTCRPRLLSEIKYGKPKIIVLLGNSAINSYFNMQVNNITKLNGNIIFRNNTIIFFAFHPSFILRYPEYEEEYKRIFKDIRIMYNYLINKYV